MKRALGLLLMAVLTVSIGFGQATEQKPETAAALPTVDQVLEKYVEAIGGKAAIEKASSRVAKGAFELPAMGATGTVTVFAKAPNKTAVVIDIPSFGLVKQGFDGTVGWSSDPMSGLTESSGAALAAAKRDAVFHRELVLKEQFKTMEVKGKQTIGDKETYIVEATPELGAPEKMYFEVATGLLVRVDAERSSPQGVMNVETSMKDYREVDGVKIPFVLEQTMPNLSFVIKFEEVKNNVEIDDAQFTKPIS